MDKRDTERGYSTSDIIHEYENMDPTEDYDAFNEDTFGNNVETWTKEDHDQLVGAHVTEVIYEEYNENKYYPKHWKTITQYTKNMTPCLLDLS